MRVRISVTQIPLGRVSSFDRGKTVSLRSCELREGKEKLKMNQKGKKEIMSNHFSFLLSIIIIKRDPSSQFLVLAPLILN